MKSYIKIIVWFICYLLLILASNYFVNIRVYETNYSIFDILISNAALLIICLALINLSPVKKYRYLRLFGYVFTYIVLFIAISEVVVVKYSGVGFVTQSFLHFELESLKVGFQIYPFKISLILFVLFFILWLFTLPIKQTSFSFYFLTILISFLILYSTNLGSALGRLITNYTEFKNKPPTKALSAGDVMGFEKFGIKPVFFTNNHIEAKIKGNKKNVIVLYLESFSHFFTTSKQYPNLTPNLSLLSRKYGQLDNYHSTAGFTMQGLMSSMCGFLPEMLFENDNLNVDEQPYQQLTCFPDILHHLGYHQEFIGGARKAFSNKEIFLSNHKFDKVWGWLDYKKDKTYKKNDWGLQDDDLFDFTLKRIDELRKSETPFHISLLNLSTHLSGNPAPTCPKYTQGTKQHKYLDGIHCLDYLVGWFINKLNQKGVLENTVVYITSDHGVFGVDLIKNLFGKNNDHHKLFGMVIDKDFKFDKKKLVGLYDLAPNILELLNIETNITFINGIPFNENLDNRFLLRRGFLRQGLNQLKTTQTCNEVQKIDFPIDTCEKRRLIKISYGHAAAFTTNINAFDISKNSNKIIIQSSTIKNHPSELVIKELRQDDKFYNEGYLINTYKKKQENYLFVWVYDLNNQSIIQRRAFIYKKGKAYRFPRMLKKLKDNFLLIIFTSGSKKIDIPLDYVKTLIGLGAEKITIKHKPYVAIYKKEKGKQYYAEWTTNQESILVNLNGINDSELMLKNNLK